MEKLRLRPEQSTYVYTNGDEIISTQLEGGASRFRRDVVGAAATVRCTWTLDLNGYQYLRAFYNLATDKGALPFLIDLLIDQPTLEEYEARILPGTVEMSRPLGYSRQQSMTLEVIPVHNPEVDRLIIDAFDNDWINPLERLTNFDWFLPNG